MVVKMDGRYSPGVRKWHLRFAVTARCNFRCRYCLPANIQIPTKDPCFPDMVEILQAAYNNGIRRVHWTGGEPTIRKVFIDLVNAAKEIGFTQQIVTTNGSGLWKNLDELVANGLTRVIVSIDTLDAERNEFITRAKHFENTLKSLETSVMQLSTLTKMSVVTMKSTLKELEGFIALAQTLNHKYPGEVAVKLNQFFPSNPAQLSKEGQRFWREEFATEAEIMAALNNIGSLKPISRDSVEGDNPTYQYYLVGDTDVKVAVLALFSWRFPCGGCWKLRVSPQGIATICINQKDPPNIWGKTLDEKTKILGELMAYRESPKLSADYPNRKHYRAQLGEMRFDKVAGCPRGIEFFYSLLQEDFK